MKRFNFLVVLLLVVCVTAGFAKKTKPNDATLVSHSPNQTIVKFKITDYDLTEVQTADGVLHKLTAPNTSPVLERGVPDLRKMSAALIVSDSEDMEFSILNSQYEDIANVNLAPSKGNLLRTVNPDDVPYEYGPEYRTDAFYPSNIVELNEPYIARDYRGQAIILYPFQYNPVTKVLRVYTKVRVKVSPSGKKGKNGFNQRRRGNVSRAFNNVYSRHFLNYDAASSSMSQVKYTTLPDDMGTLLIVCYGSFMDEMADFVTWKESIGYTVDLVDYATIGSASALKTYVANYYNTNGLEFLLLVGDNSQVAVSSTSNGDSDNTYGYIVGSDSYQDIFVGRFSAETGAQVTTQVDRTLYYERDLSSSASWFNHAIGCGSAEGPGHNNEYDYQHVNNILTDCSGYGYTTHTNHQTGGSTSALSTLFNNGAGVMFYCGHGYDTGWSCGWTFSSTNVNALTNENELPFIFNVACVVGNFKSQTCFCEAWMRATNNGNPTGSIAHCGSTINQSWEPPMDAQDEMADILVSSSGPKRTFGGAFVNGMFKMIDINGSSGISMSDTWVCFGDPSVQLRTPGTPEGPTPSNPDPPVAEFTSDTTTVTVGGSVDFTDQSSNNPTSWSWTFAGGTPSSSTAGNPTVTYNTQGTYTVSLTATNSAGNDTETKTNYITVTAPQAPAANFTASSTTIYAGQNVIFSDTSANGPTSWSWTFAGGTPSSSTSQDPTVTYNTAGTYTVSLTATNIAGSDTETKTNYITVSDAPLDYCDSQGNNYSYEYIGNVTVADLDNTSSGSNYTDYTSLTANLTAGASANVSLTPVFPSTTYTEYWKIWIDYNIDGDFDDTGEEVFSDVSTGTVTGSFTVPSGASGLTRMRVSMKWNAAQTSCESFSYGEVEDYSVYIDGSTPPDPPVADFSASAVTIDVGDSVNFTDLSTNTPTSWSWSFAGGTPSSSTAQDPTVTYNTAGTYDVTLTATNAGGSDGETKTAYITVNVVVPDPPVADFSASPTTVTEGGSVSFTDLSSNSPTSWSWSFPGGTPSTSTAQNPTVVYNTDGVYAVTLTAANAGGSDGETKTAYITVNDPSTGLVFESGTVSGVGSSWQSVTLGNTYTSPVVVCSTGIADSSAIPVVVRVRNAAGNSFDVLVQNPSGTALSGHTVHYVVVEEGVYTSAADGVTMEAVKVDSTATAENNNWVLEPRTYQNTYTNPVVVGQVMTYNDAGWSVFWACGASRTAPPSASDFNAGKEVGEDTDTTRADETIGYIVIEQGSGTINSVPYTAALGADTVRGPDNTSTGYTYSFTSVGTASAAIVSQAAIDGGNGGWPVLFGSNPFTASSITMVCDEDQVGDSERKHTTEQIAYIVFGQ